MLESWRSLGSPQLPGPSFPAYGSPPTANRRVHWWGFTTLQDGSRRILPPVRLGKRHAPNVGADRLNEPGEIRFSVNSPCRFIHLHNSYLHFRGKLSREVADAGSFDFPSGANITLINNSLRYLFSNIRFNLGGQEVENLQDPGQVTTMLGLFKYNDDFIKSGGLNQCWLKDSGTGAFADNDGMIARRNFVLRNNGNFSFSVPLSHIFGFFEDYDKVLYGTNYELILNRQRNTQALFRANPVANGTIYLSAL